ncbi:peptidase S8 [Rubrivivax albus]|uniref:Peptidase S8 n=2 Tax=Rubrivivax albus TaxID=2499835 RepID=A0A3S2U5Z1_9BURK|nr:peptidase S8 [Rubrivivax albus]
MKVPAAAAEGGRLWFVELAGAPVADGRTRAAVLSEKAAFRAAARAAGVKFKERRAFDTLFNGFSVEVDTVNRAKLLRLKGVKAMYPVQLIERPAVAQANDSAPDLAFALSLTGADIAQNQLGLSGAGVKVGIIDTGIDIDHPAFGGSGTPGTTPFPSARVVAGYDLVGDNYNAGGTPEQQIPVPDENPDDCGGHGTHVAGIVGADGGGLKGVAPGVTFGAYRVFGCAGSSSSDVIVEALERAYADGMQVINQSLGAARQWPQYPTAQASSRLTAKGVVMVASTGNNGPLGSSPDGLWAAGAPGTGSKVIATASFDNAQRSFQVNGTPYGFNPATGSPLPPTEGSLPMARTGTTTTTNDGCNAITDDLTGKAVLIRRGSCSFYIKASNAQAAGAAAVVLYNNAAGALNATVAGTPPIAIPVVGITAAQGAVIDAAIAGGETMLNWSPEAVAYPFGTGGLISGFSSFGMAADLSIKPQIGAPGGGILSSYPLEAGGAAVLSGTSMSAPHVAGGVALLLQAKPNLRPAAVQSRIQNTADPKNWSGNPDLGFLDHAFRQGAGMLDVVGAVTATATVSPSQISTGESASGSHLQKLTVRNLSLSPATYTIGHVAGLAAGPNQIGAGASYAPTGYFDAPGTVTFSQDTLTIPPLGSATVDVIITADETLPDRALYGGYVTFTPQGTGTPMSVPYAGFKGDYQTTQVLTPTANGFPWLATLAGGSYTNQPEGATYTMADGNIPYFLMHLDHLSRRITLEAFDAVSGKAMGKVSQDEYVTRNSTPGGFFAFTWDGVTFRGKPGNPVGVKEVPNGQYVVKVSVLKALGDESNPAHWETWTSPTITVARP